MDKHYYTPLDMLKIATQHAFCAQHLLNNNAEISIDQQDQSDMLFPINSLMYMAFELLFKAFLLHEHRPVKQHKNLQELIDLNSELGLSISDRQLLKNLSRQHAFRKGIDYDLWEDRQQHLIFCVEIVDLYGRIQEMMPLELRHDYQN